MKFGSPVTRELRPYRGPGVPRPPNAGDAFYVTSPFGPRDDGFHGGLDIGNGRIGYPLVAVQAGRVLAVGLLKAPWSEATARWPSGNYGGLMVVVEHAEGVVSIYAHMRRVDVKLGDLVKGGQKLGEIGDTGSAQGQAHVHFGIQAPAHTVPATLRTRTTTFGYGLDVDPWPLISGQAELTLQEDDMKIPSGLVPLAQGVVGAGNRLRVDPFTTEGSRVLEGAYWVQVYGTDVPGQPYTLDGKAGSTYMWVGVFGETWFVAAPLVTNIRPVAPVLPPADCSAQEATIAQLNGKIARARTANAGAAQAQAAVEVALT